MSLDSALKFAKNASAEKVKLGLRNDTTVQIVDGLNAGDTVLITGIMQMRPQMPVKVNIQ